MKATPSQPDWRDRAIRLREMAAEIAAIASHFNLERESCTCGESHRWKDMNQWQLNERCLGVIERMNNLADTIERRAHEFTPKTTEKCK
jgi:hypothetical protein